jgi:hypothetical protein
MQLSNESKTGLSHEEKLKFGKCNNIYVKYIREALSQISFTSIFGFSDLTSSQYLTTANFSLSDNDRPVPFFREFIFKTNVLRNQEFQI